MGRLSASTGGAEGGDPGGGRTPPLLAFYGDDFTGSTDVLDMLARAGVPAVLYLAPPTPALAARFPAARVVGLAGMSRAMTPDEMEAALPAAFAALAGLGAPLVHYKVCSTFDSAPGIGSIGRAIDIARRTFPCAFVPVIAGAPALGRYTVFGNHFAAVDGRVHRLDRHPVMARHPVTPMAEADLVRHLAMQTGTPVGLVDVVALATDGGERRLAEVREAGAGIVLVDVLDDASLAAAGRLVLRHAATTQLVVGSSGVEQALADHLRALGAGGAPAPPPPGPAGRLLVVSGSCSPVTARQIDAAEAAGFRILALDPARMLDPEARTAEEARLAAAATAALVGRGDSVVVASARGPDDPSVERGRAAAEAAGLGPAALEAAIGESLGRIARRVVADAGLARLVVAGGDTSGRVAGVLGLAALTVAAAAHPGAPLCRAAAADPALDGLEVAFKGGQMGGPDFFAALRDGAAGTPPLAAAPASRPSPVRDMP